MFFLVWSQQGMPKTPQEFAAELIQKLEAVKRDRESEEKLLRIVAEVGGILPFSHVFSFKQPKCFFSKNYLFSYRGIVKPVDWMSHARKAPASNPDLNAQLVFWQKHCPKSLLQMKPTHNRFSVMSTILSLVQFYLNRVDYYYFYR